MTTACRCLLFGLIVATNLASPAFAQLPAPRWVQMFDQGQANPKLKGIEAPRGIKVEIVAEGPLAADVREILFGDDRVLYALTTKDELVALRDTNADQAFDKADVVMTAVAESTSVLVHEGWFYLAGGGQVIRRRPHDAALFKQLQAAAEAKSGPPTALLEGDQWIEQVLLHGLADQPADQTGGLVAGDNGWLYLSIGGAINRAESWDGSKATVLGSGAIFRFRPDGSRLHEFARGLASPAGRLAGDGLGNVFQAERSPTGSRLVHVLEGGDYGWQSNIVLQQLDRPGTLPAMQTVNGGKFTGVLCYWGNAFPAFLQRLLIVADEQSAALRAYGLERDGVTFAVSSEFDLVRGDDPLCMPTQAIQGPDDAIYVLCGQCRILRLSWSGTKDAPAIALPPLAELPSTEDPPPRDKLLATLLDQTVPTPDRVAAFRSLSNQWDAAQLDASLTLLEHKDADLQRLAADALGDHLPDDVPTQEKMAGQMQQCLLTASLPARRALYIALGKLGMKLETVPEWIFEATSVTPELQANRQLFDGHVRAVEMPKGWAPELLLGNLEVALFDPNPEPDERQRLKKFVTATAEAMRTRELADFLNRAIRDEKDYFSKLDSPLQVRLLTAYQNVVHIEPPARADAVAEWLEKHPAAAAEVQEAAWGTLGKVGVEKPDAVVRLARKLAAEKIDPLIKPGVIATLKPHLIPGKPGEIDQVLEAVRKQ